MVILKKCDIVYIKSRIRESYGGTVLYSKLLQSNTGEEYYLSACVQDNPYWNNLVFNIREMVLEKEQIRQLLVFPKKVFLDHLISSIGTYRS